MIGLIPGAPSAPNIRGKTPLKEGETPCSIYFDAKTTREESNILRDAWLAEVQRMPNFICKNTLHEYKIRGIPQKDEKWGTLGIAPHEWGVEYIFSFAAGVTSGIMANAIYDVLKFHLPIFTKNIKKTLPENYKIMKIDVQLDTCDGPIDIAVIQKGEVKLVVTVDDLSQVIGKLKNE